MNSTSNSNTPSRSSSNTLLHLGMTATPSRKNSFFVSNKDSPSMTWTPFFDDEAAELSCDTITAKNFDLNAFTAFESLHVDDLINHDSASVSSSSASDMYRDSSSGLHNLPAWSTTEDGDDWNGPSPVNSDGAVDDKAVNDVWFAPSTQLGRKKRSPIHRRGLLDEEREISPGAATANLKSCKSAPQLVQQEKPRVTSADHRAKLEDLLFEMGWPREEAVDGGSEGQSQSDRRGGSISSGNGGGIPTSSSGSSFSTGAGSLASGMPVTSALFRRRAANMKEGDMPAPSQVAIPATDEVTKSITAPVAMTSIPSVNVDYSMRPPPEQPHCRSATFPSSHNTLDPSLMSRPAYQPSISATSLPSNGMFNQQQQQQYTNQDVNARQQAQAALFYEMATRASPFAQQQALLTQSPFPSTASGSISSASTSTLEVRTPITPFQNLSTNDLTATSLQYGYSPVSNMSALPNQLLPPYSMAYPMKVKNQSDLDINGTYGNALGLQYIAPPPIQQLPTTNMIDSSSYSQIFSGMSTFASQPSLKQMRSSPNMRVSPTSEGSPMKSPLRKIASNRRLTINSSDGINLSSPTKSPTKKGKSPKNPSHGGVSLPPMPSLMSTASSGTTSSFEFVNYGIQDADELCSAVAPSGSYKVPLKGYGSNIDDQDDDEDQDDAEGDEAAEKRLHRSRSKSSCRLGPRWQGVDGDDDEVSSNGGSNHSDKSSSRHIKRRKSEVHMMLSSPGKKKTASSGNLRRKDSRQFLS